MTIPSGRTPSQDAMRFGCALPAAQTPMRRQPVCRILGSHRPIAAKPQNPAADLATTRWMVVPEGRLCSNELVHVKPGVRLPARCDLGVTM